MAIMAPAAPEQTLIGLIRSCSRGPVFVATETKISPFENNSRSSGTFHHLLDWQPLHSTPNSQTTIATSLESPSPSPATDWEQLLNHPSGGFELPLWSAKAAGDDFALHESPLAKHVDDARTPTLQPQLLEAVEGTTIATATMDGLVVAATAPPENPCTTSAKASPPRSPHHHGVDLANTNSRKRKKDRSSSDPKRGEQEEGVDSKTGKRSQRGREQSSSETSGESAGAGKESHHHRPRRRDPERNPKPEFSKQDYIHVRARRGQATDSHSLAERVRREKMSERMKFLQDLVPGCRKVTGKAVMLDEIINYVQSLQQQVESLSMKLASVSPAQSSHWTLESLLTNKEILQAQQFSSNGAAAAAAGAFAMQPRRMPPPSATATAATAAAAQQHVLPFGFDFRNSSSSGSLGSRTLATPSATDFADLTTSVRPFDATGHQFTGRDGELQSVVHMGLHQQDDLGSFASQLQCQFPAGGMKVEF